MKHSKHIYYNANQQMLTIFSLNDSTGIVTRGVESVKFSKHNKRINSVADFVISALIIPLYNFTISIIIRVEKKSDIFYF